MRCARTIAPLMVSTSIWTARILPPDARSHVRFCCCGVRPAAPDVTRNPWRFGRAMRPISGRARLCPAGTIFRKKRRMKPTASFASSLSRTAGKPPERSTGLPTTKPRRPWYTVLYIQVLLAIAVGVLIGHYFPHAGAALKPLGDGFIALIKMMIAPVIFCTVVHGIGSMRDLKKVGRVGVKTLFYFEAVSTLALVMGLVVGKLLQPGKGFESIRPHSMPMRSQATSIAPRRRGLSPICWGSSR